MKRILFIIFSASLLLGTASCSKGLSASQVPKSVITAFNKNFPGASNTKWKAKGDGYEATFTAKGGQKTTAIIGSDGSISNKK